MVLRCSLLGHDYGEPEVEREREERGSEAVVTVQEYEECSRCGERHVISETTEVTSVPAETTAGPDANDRDGVDAAVPEEREEGGTEAIDADVEAAEPPSTDETGPDETVTDDAEILEDEHPDAGRGRGEWPDSDDVGPPAESDREPAAWPETDVETDGREEDGPDADGAVLVDASAGGGSTAGGDASESETGIESAGSAPAPGEGGSLEDVATEFFCPRCEFVAPNDRGSLRTGDICPECKKGYLGERER